MSDMTYEQRRGEIAHYFDRTAVAAWEKLTSDAPVGRIRASVRAGRDQMRATIVSWLGEDLTGKRVLMQAVAPAPWRSRRRAGEPKWWPLTCRLHWWICARAHSCGCGG